MQSDFCCCNVHTNKAVQNTAEQNKVRGQVITGEDILRRRGRLYCDRGDRGSITFEGRFSQGGDYIT